MTPTIALKCRLKARPDGSVVYTSQAPLAPPPALPTHTILPPAARTPHIVVQRKQQLQQQQQQQKRQSTQQTIPKRGVSPVFVCDQGTVSNPAVAIDGEAAEGIQLLLGIATIVSKEVANSGCQKEEFFKDDDDDDDQTYDAGRRGVVPMTPPQSSFVKTITPASRRVGLLDSDSDDDKDTTMYGWNRARSVSIDSPNHHHGQHGPRGLIERQRQQMQLQEQLQQQQRQRQLGSAAGGKKHGFQSLPVLSSTNYPLPTMISPVSRSSPPTTSTFSSTSTASRRAGARTAKSAATTNKMKFIPHKAARKEQIKFPKLPQLTAPTCTVEEYTKKAFQIAKRKGLPIVTIGRKKFSWKNYPELEAFLIANREEYLRHSALNYTVQQKQYNNRLTERLLELASKHGYIFDGAEFNFVTVRDRVRCYYKSFVQSSKKRGIVLGYAARKAGILTTADLQKSAQQEATIFTPMESDSS